MSQGTKVAAAAAFGLDATPAEAGLQLVPETGSALPPVGSVLPPAAPVVAEPPAGVPAEGRGKVVAHRPRRKTTNRTRTRIRFTVPETAAGWVDDRVQAESVPRALIVLRAIEDGQQVLADPVTRAGVLGHGPTGPVLDEGRLFPARPARMRISGTEVDMEVTNAELLVLDRLVRDWKASSRSELCRAAVILAADAA